MKSFPNPTGPQQYGTATRPRVRKIGALVGQLMARRGYAQVAASEEFHQIIANTLGGELASSFQVGNLRRGVLLVYARDSVTLQEMNFQKQVILRQLKQHMPHSDVNDLRFRIQV